MTEKAPLTPLSGTDIAADLATSRKAWDTFVNEHPDRDHLRSLIDPTVISAGTLDAALEAKLEDNQNATH